tara:strand:+ start:4167 stop:5480 length:1314 start_codon:yes stop_codon:yes gene_type:complete
MDKQSPIQKAFVVEIALLKAMSTQYNYKNYIDYVVVERLLEETQILLDSYDRYYALYPDHLSIEWDTFRTQFVTNWHAKDMHNEQIELFSTAIERIRDADEIESESALLGLVNKQFIDKINKISEKPFDGEVIRKELDAYENKYASIIQECDQECYNLAEIDLSEADPEDGIPYAFQGLQDACFGQVRGDLILLNAGTNVGKSAFMYTQMVHTYLYLIANNIDQPILFFNSEGSAAQFLGRFLSNLYHAEIPEGYRKIIQNKEKVMANFLEQYDSNKIKFYRANNKGIGFVRNKIKKYKPAVVYIDMLKGILPSGKTNELSVLEEGAQSLRDISADYCPIWATVQAGDSCKWWNEKQKKLEWKKWLDSRDIRGDKDGIQGAASTIIGIGCHDNPKVSTTRYIQTSKNKSEGFAKFICEIDFNTSRYTESDNEDWETF